jgi:uncharacterized protein (DUF1501 family)
MNHPLCNATEHALSRRQWLGGVGGAAAAGALGGLISPASGEVLKKKEKQVLFIWLDGGMSQLESWDPKPNTQFGGPFRSIPTNLPGVHVSELMPRMAKKMDKICLVRGICTKDNSHSRGVGRIQRGDPKDRGVIYPYIGSAIAKLMGPTASGLPPYVWVKPGSGGFKPTDAGFLGPKFGALAFGDGQPPPNFVRPESLSAEQDAARNELRRALNLNYAQPRRKANTEANSFVFDSADALLARSDIFDATQYPRKEKERYGQHLLGEHMLIGRKLLEAGCRFVKVNSYGWDTHGDNFNGSTSLVGSFDQAFAAVLEDLEATGRLDHTLVIAMSEFGRTPRINGHAGRDHWPEAWSIAMTGCGLNRGVVLGETNANGTFVKGDAWDIGHLFHTWFHALGINSHDIEFDNGGQPLPIAHDDLGVIPGALA